MPSIASVTGRQILDSRGRPTVEATVLLSDGTLLLHRCPQVQLVMILKPMSFVTKTHPVFWLWVFKKQLS